MYITTATIHRLNPPDPDLFVKVAPMGQYTASVPSDGQVRPEIKEFFEKFYEASDDPTEHEKYSEQFTKKGKLIMGPNESNGRDGKLFCTSLTNVHRRGPTTTFTHV